MHSTSKLSGPRPGEFPKMAAPAPSESIHRRNSASKPNPSSCTFFWASKRDDFKSRLANSLAHATAFRLPPLRTCSMADFNAMTPLEHTPCSVAISQRSEEHTSELQSHL